MGTLPRVTFRKGGKIYPLLFFHPPSALRGGGTAQLRMALRWLRAGEGSRPSLPNAGSGLLMLAGWGRQQLWVPQVGAARPPWPLPTARAVRAAALCPPQARCRRRARAGRQKHWCSQRSRQQSTASPAAGRRAALASCRGHRQFSSLWRATAERWEAIGFGSWVLCVDAPVQAGVCMCTCRCVSAQEGRSLAVERYMSGAVGWFCSQRAHASPAHGRVTPSRGSCSPAPRMLPGRGSQGTSPPGGRGRRVGATAPRPGASRHLGSCPCSGERS